jgi:thymidylate kinase
MTDGPTATVICIAGGDGSGKSTQIARLTAFFEEQQRKVMPVSIWDAFSDPAIVSKLPFERPSDVYRYLKLLSPVSRTHFLFHALHLALERASDRMPNVLLLNAYWYKYFATEVAHGGDPALLRQLAAGFPEPDLTFYLSVGPEAALARKSHRSDYESGYGQDEQTSLDFQRRAHEALQALAAEYCWTELDGRSSPSEITTAMIRQVEEVGCGGAR